jgi:hypothetical protein
VTALVSILSQEENKYVFELLMKGVYCLNAVQNSTDKKWIWGDGTVWDYYNWAEGEPNVGNVYLKTADKDNWVKTGSAGSAYDYAESRFLRHPGILDGGKI